MISVIKKDLFLIFFQADICLYISLVVIYDVLKNFDSIIFRNTSLELSNN